MLNVRVALVGPGAIGSAFLRQLTESLGSLATNMKASITLVAVANSKTMVACSGADLLPNWREELRLVSETDGTALMVKDLGQQMQTHCRVCLEEGEIILFGPAIGDRHHNSHEKCRREL